MIGLASIGAWCRFAAAPEPQRCADASASRARDGSTPSGQSLAGKERFRPRPMVATRNRIPEVLPVPPGDSPEVLDRGRELLRVSEAISSQLQP